jgi:hypothetical protein
MRIWPKRAAGPRPRTCVGLWLRAALLDQRELRDQLRATLNGGKAGWNYDEPAVVEAVCLVALRRLFPAGLDAHAISAFVSDLRSRIHSTPPPGQLETEALIRAALGDPDVIIRHIPYAEVFQAHTAVIGAACVRFGLNEAAIDQMINEGERIAFAHGWQPPLAS